MKINKNYKKSIPSEQVLTQPEKCGDTQGGGCLKTGVMLPQAREWEAPEPARARKDSALFLVILKFGL